MARTDIAALFQKELQGLEDRVRGLLNGLEESVRARFQCLDSALGAIKTCAAASELNKEEVQIRVAPREAVGRKSRCAWPIAQRLEFVPAPPASLVV